MQRPWNQQKTREEWSLCVQCRYTVERPPPLQHRLAPSSLDGQCQWCPVPLLGTSCSTGGELFNAGSLETGVDTDTHSCLARDISTKLLLLLSMILLAPLRTVSRSGVPCITSSNRWSEQHEALSARSPREAGVSRTDRSGGNTFH